MAAGKWLHSPRSWRGKSRNYRQQDALLQPPVVEENISISDECSFASQHISPLRNASPFREGTASTSPFHEETAASSESSGILAYRTYASTNESIVTSYSTNISHVQRKRTKARLTRASYSCRARVPKGTSSAVVFFLNVIESFVFYGALNNILRVLLNRSSEFETALTLLVEFTIGRILYPVAGFLADAYFGRYRMINIGLWLFWLSFALLALSLSILDSLPSDVTGLTTHVLPITAYVLIAVGSSSFEVTIIPFGVDQLSQGASSAEQSSYFFWYYFGRQLGDLLGEITFYGLSLISIENDYHHKYSISSIQSIVALAVVTTALILLWCNSRNLFKDRCRENPLRNVVNVLHYAATVTYRGPIRRRAFRYGELKKSRMEQAKYQYDGIFTSEEVEDVKTFCRIILIIFSLGLSFMAYNGVFVMLQYQVSNIYKVEFDLFLFFPYMFVLWNGVIIMLILPVLNFIIVPCLPSSTIRERMGFGCALIALSAGISAYLEWLVFPDVSPQHKFLWLILPTVFVSVGEALLFVAALEFIYAQSPEQMKGLLTGLTYMTFGLFSGAATLVFLYFPKSSQSQLHAYGWYFVIYSIIGLVGCVMFVVAARLYSNRDRPEEEEYEQI